MPKISVIMPIYNTGQQMYKTLMSLMGQIEKDFEVLMIDDGSTDELTIEIEETFQRFDKRFRLYRNQQNMGPGPSRNKGIDIAEGEYIIFLDSDDLFCDDMLSEMIDTMDESKADICIANFMMLDVVSNVKSPIYAKEKESVTERAFAAWELGEDGLSYWMPLQGNKMLRREFVRDNGLCYQSLSDCEDISFGFSCVIKAKKIVYCRKREPLFIYRVNNPKQLSYDVDSRNFARAFEYLLDGVVDKDNELLVKQVSTEMKKTMNDMMTRCSNQEYNRQCREMVDELLSRYGF
jgi:glycosyltransferase involved in cell wall biosynthesis